ncbi:MAG TPA: SpoIID/LytB domain-containing protein [Thermoleophilaceae bacterium]|nr:SpoIID/LytB domain-containing protein [Thermoleophilaceae bacterium]
MRRALATTPLLLAALTPATAHGATTHVVRGAGFGHGVGMSQYGAYGMAQKGFGFGRILAHYYRGPRLSPAPSRPIRILLQASDPQVRFRGATRAPGGKALGRGTTYIARGAGGRRVSLSARGKRIGTFTAPVRVDGRGAPMRLLGRAINGVTSGTYRGTFELRPGAGGGVTAVNSLPLDSYVQGVVAGEMPSSWDIDALRAQSVTARTYAMATRKPSTIFDHYPDTRSQVYRGVRGETGRSNAAVRATAGKILTYRGRPAVTYYFSTSGGRTESVEFSALGGPPRAWLQGVEDPYDDISPRHRWRFRFSSSQLGARLGAPGRFRRVRVLKRGRSPRIVRARVYGSRGSRLLTGAQIRARLGLYDSWAYFTKVSTSQVTRARASRGAVTPLASPEIKGSFEPAPRSRLVLVERRRRGRWERVDEVGTSARGRYRSLVAVPAVYRVRSAGVIGPAVRVRR